MVNKQKYSIKQISFGKRKRFKHEKPAYMNRLRIDNKIRRDENGLILKNNENTTKISSGTINGITDNVLFMTPLKSSTSNIIKITTQKT